MAKEIRIPELGEGIEAAEVISVLVSEGDRIVEDQPIIELETDKATAEVPATFGGIVMTIHVKKGDQVGVGQTILTIEESGAAAEKPAAGSDEHAETKAQPAGKAASRTAPASPPEPEATPEAAEPAVIEAADIVAESEPAERAVSGQAATAPASPSVRRLARELGIDIHAVPGTGGGGRITDSDVKEHARAALTTRGAAGGRSRPGAAPGEISLPDFSRWGEVERQPMSRVRRRTAENMARAWATIPQVTQFDRADITEVETFRKGSSHRVEEAGGKLTLTAVMVKVAAAILQGFPRFNASLDPSGEEIILKKYVNIGVAVDTERGLLVPVIHGADGKSLLRIAVELTELAEKARARKAALEDLSGASFTITNLGGLGTTYFSPIVNWPETAILGVGRARHEPVYADGELRPRLILPLSISYDHRVIDGADAARFLRRVAEALENPLLLLLEA
jgi:pyruvate dehydrogenase E2 component (dihydrolipoamide acetyltransferase)